MLTQEIASSALPHSAMSSTVCSTVVRDGHEEDAVRLATSTHVATAIRVGAAIRRGAEI
jgi:hypothetical protein